MCWKSAVGKCVSCLAPQTARLNHDDNDCLHRVWSRCLVSGVLGMRRKWNSSAKRLTRDLRLHLWLVLKERIAAALIGDPSQRNGSGGYGEWLAVWTEGLTGLPCRAVPRSAVTRDFSRIFHYMTLATWNICDVYLTFWSCRLLSH
jgi:hypothetical protein